MTENAKSTLYALNVQIVHSLLVLWGSIQSFLIHHLMSHKYLNLQLNTEALFKILFARKVPLEMHSSARPHAAAALSGSAVQMSYWVSRHAANKSAC